ncbi:MAG: hypothetical protein U9N05_02530 [Euryarchaeota archaeon]|nr:hypothetical protein [Euryarchaeota archaeon]
MKPGRLILITMVLVVILAGTASAHTYDPDKKNDWKVNNVEENEMVWGNTIEVDAKGLNTTYTIELNDFNVKVSEIDLDEIERIKGKDYECGDCSKSQYVDQIEYSGKTANLRIYDGYELVGSFPFRADGSALESGSIFSIKESSWDTGGTIWNYNNDFFVAVSKITCEFADEDCFCTDPKSEKATIRYLVRKPAEFEADITTIVPGGEEEEEMLEFRSNSVFKAEIELSNNEMRAYHLNAWFSVKPTETIDGEYPPDCEMVRAYRGTDEDMINRTTELPINIRSGDPCIGERDDWFEGDSDMVMDEKVGKDELTYTVYFKTPSIPKRTEYAVWVNLTYEDLKGKTRQFTDNSTTIEILPVLEVKKAIGTGDYAIVAEEAAEAYTSEVTYVIHENYEPYVFLTVINWGDYEIPSIRLSDAPNGTWHRTATTDFNKWDCALPADMLRIPEMGQDQWDWDFSLEPGKVMTCAYPVSLLKPGTYKLGNAAVNWTENGYEYGVISYSQQVKVHGPYIVVTKTVDPAIVEQNGTAKIVVRVKNDGDRPASVKIADQIPMESELVGAIPVRGITIDEDSGVFSVTRVLESGAEELFEYEIDPNRTVMLPPAVVEFVDLTQYAAISVSEMPILVVNGTEPIGAAAEKIKAESEKTSAAAAAASVGAGAGGSDVVVEAAETPVRREPGFAGILAILACLAAVLISKRLRKD